jgi:ParB/RepB/Spo0J family partition protein
VKKSDSPVIFECALVRLDQISSGDNIRRTTDPEELAHLAGSMAILGLMLPIGVTKTEDGLYRILWGHRRVAAARLLNWSEIRAIVRDTDQSRLLALVENIVREPLPTADEALAVYHVIKSGVCSQNQLANSLGRDRSYISRAKRLGELVEKMGTEVSWTKLKPSVYWELLKTPELIPRAEAEDWNQETAREEALRHKRDANQESLPLQPGHVPASGKAKRRRPAKPVTNETLPTFEPVIQYDDGFTIQEFSFSARRPVDREAVIAKLTDLQVKIDYCIERLRTELTVTPEADPAIENHTREGGGHAV